MRILLVEDTKALARTIADGLAEEGLSVDVASDGEEGLHLAREIAYDAIVLDRMLPRLEGVALLRALRAAGVATPVLFLTALGELRDRVEGLDVGADDYLVKPFAFDELLARLRALLRRSRGQARNEVAVGRLRIDLAARAASVDGRPLDLTAREFALLELLALEPGRTFSRTALSEKLYEEDKDLDSNVIDVFVGRVRRKLDAAGLPGGDVIRTQRGAGYRLDPGAAGKGAP